LKKIILVQRANRTNVCKKASDHKTKKNGSVSQNLSKPKQISTKREEAKSAVEQMLEEFPQFSIRKAASALTVSPTLVCHILYEDLLYKPYKLPPNHKFFFHF
jgi:hypothetical protein